MVDWRMRGQLSETARIRRYSSRRAESAVIKSSIALMVGCGDADAWLHVDLSACLLPVGRAKRAPNGTNCPAVAACSTLYRLLQPVSEQNNLTLTNTARVRVVRAGPERESPFSSSLAYRVSTSRAQSARNETRQQGWWQGASCPNET
jgi:hypothetical protein